MSTFIQVTRTTVLTSASILGSIFAASCFGAGPLGIGVGIASGLLIKLLDKEFGDELWGLIYKEELIAKGPGIPYLGCKDAKV